jgi:hypothetical protein
MKKLFIRAALGGLLAVAMHCAVAGSFEDGISALEQGDFASAARHFKPYAEQGYPSAQINLGILYAMGQGVPQDDVQAHLWFNLAAAKGDKEGEENRTKVESRMSPAQVEEATRLAREWTPAKSGHVEKKARKSAAKSGARSAGKSAAAKSAEPAEI